MNFDLRYQEWTATESAQCRSRKMPYIELQIRGGIKDNSKKNFLISQNLCCDPSLEPSQRDGSNGGSQHMY